MAKQDVENVQNVLILALSGIGNFIMQSPAIFALKKAYPDAHITCWVAPRGTKPLAEIHPAIDSIIEAPIKLSPIRHMKMMLRLSKERYDTGIVLSPGQLIKSAAYLYLAGVKRRIGNTYPFRGNPESSLLLTDGIVEDGAIHDIEQNLRLVEPLNVDIQPYLHESYTVSLPKDAVQDAETYLQENAIAKDKVLVGIHAGSAPDFLWKRWPLERFAEVAKYFIQKNNVHILLFGGPDEQEQNKELVRYINSNENVSLVSTSLLTTGAIMKECAYLISNDSGLMHLAASVGTKVFGLFGPTDEGKTGPRGENSITIRADGTKAIYDTEQNFNLGSTPHETILAITPELVISTIEDTVSAQ